MNTSYPPAPVNYSMESDAEVVHAFHGELPSFKYLFRDGSEAIFMPNPENPGKSIYYTDNYDKIRELNRECIAPGHPHIFVKKGEETVSKDLLDPVKKMKAILRREILLEMQAQNAARAENVVPGDSVSPQFNPASTRQLGILTGQEDKNSTSGVLSNPTVTGEEIPTDQKPALIVPPNPGTINLNMLKVPKNS